ncbi:unnamed protein product [Echinostoma caproni]|uniref:Transposase n=1 Tax=Echinostoma caproni TaxID=27848 RepID=A0A183B5W5_9TREM|nr:unnamed protein product [Echinostoma caproni]
MRTYSACPGYKLYQCLSSTLQYFGQQYTLTELAEMADRVYADQMSVQSYTQPAPPPHSTDTAELVACVKALVAQVQAFTLSRDRPRQRHRTRSKHRSRIPGAHDFDHRRTGFAGITADTVMAQRSVSHRAHIPPGRETSKPIGPGNDCIRLATTKSPVFRHRPNYRDTFPG